MQKNTSQILCVDDEPSILRALSWVLKKNYEVTTATCGTEALEIFGKKDFDVIISDQRMPGMMGAEVLQKARDINPRSMRILLTGYSDMDAIIDSVNEGEIYRFLNKPWRIPELQKVVREATEIAKAAIDKASASSATPKLDAAQVTILIIDDDEASIELVKGAIGSQAQYLVANNISDAIAAMEMPNIGVVISELFVGGVDVSRLVKKMKERSPDITTIVISSRSDSQEVIDLINQGQIFRFLFKPVKQGALKMMIGSALRKHLEMKNDPLLLSRYRVDSLTEEDRSSLMQDLQKNMPANVQAEDGSEEGGLMSRFTTGFRRLFG